MNSPGNDQLKREMLPGERLTNTSVAKGNHVSAIYGFGIIDEMNKCKRQQNTRESPSNG